MRGVTGDGRVPDWQLYSGFFQEPAVICDGEQVPAERHRWLVSARSRRSAGRAAQCPPRRPPRRGRAGGEHLGDDGPAFRLIVGIVESKVSTRPSARATTQAMSSPAGTPTSQAGCPPRYVNLALVGKSPSPPLTGYRRADRTCIHRLGQRLPGERRSSLPAWSFPRPSLVSRFRISHSR